jgi:hypothetical protein
MLFAAVHESLSGTFRKCRLQRSTSAFGAKADLVNSVIGAEWALLLVRGMFDLECPLSGAQQT